MSISVSADERVDGGVSRLQALVLTDRELRETLGRVPTPDAFVAVALSMARDRGLTLEASAIASQLAPDPLGLSRLQAPRGIAPAAPQPGWLPVQAGHDGVDYAVDWAWFGEHQLTEPFFEAAVRRALSLPFNRLFGFRTPLADVVAWADALPTIEPSGLIFHMSRCGSTLAAQMLAATPAHVVVSEASPLDRVVQIAREDPGIDGPALVRAMIKVLGHARDPSAERLFVKLDCWHTLAVPLFRRALPLTPFIFMYREPVEVMVSQMRQRGSQMVPEFVPPSLYGLELPGGVPAEDYCARVLAAVCEGVLSEPAQATTLVNYTEMPGALLDRILPCFGLTLDAETEAAMAAAARFNAKASGSDFTPDSEAKRREASDTVKAATARWLSDPYARLEARRAAQATPIPD